MESAAGSSSSSERKSGAGEIHSFVRCPSSRLIHTSGCLFWVFLPMFVIGLVLGMIGGIRASIQDDARISELLQQCATLPENSRNASVYNSSVCWSVDGRMYRYYTLNEILPPGLLPPLCTHHHKLYLFSKDNGIYEIDEALRMNGLDRFHMIGYFPRRDDSNCKLRYTSEIEGANLGLIIAGPLMIGISLFILIQASAFVCTSKRSLCAERSYFCCPHHDDSPSLNGITVSETV
jgi:hypothetical protein